MYLKIKELRKLKNLSQTDLANEIGVTVKTLAGYENGTADISLSKMIKIVEFFQIDFIELFSDSKILPKTVNEPTPVYGIKQHEILDAKDEVIQSLKRENALLREMLDQAKSKQG